MADASTPKTVELPVPKLPLAADGSLDPKDAVYLLLSLTRRCNMRCPNCFYLLQQEGFFQDQDIEFDHGKRIIDFYAGNGIRQVVANAEGEILLHPRVRDFLAYVRSKSLAQRPWIVTNGLLLARHADFLLDHAGEILVSIDGPDAESHAAFRGGGRAQFETIVNSLRVLVAAKRAKNSRAEILINCVVSADRVSLIPAMIGFAEAMGVETIKFSNFHASGPTDRAPLRFADPAVMTMIRQVLRRKDYKLSIHLPHIFGSQRVQRVVLGQIQPPFWCRMLASIVVGANGHLSPCCRIAADPAWGNFDATPEKHNAPPLRAFRKAFLDAKTHDELPAICRECGHLSPKRLFFKQKAGIWGVSTIS